MALVINHLTRMHQGHICVAGIDLNGGRHVRPDLGTPFGYQWCTTYGGFFALGEVIDFGRLEPTGQRPHVEDHGFRPQAVRRLKQISPEEFWTALDGVALGNLEAIFGPDLVPRSGSFACAEHHGIASLGCLRCANPLEMQLADDRLRIKLTLDGGSRTVAVTDLRCFALEGRAFAVQAGTVQALNARLASEDEVILSVGLGRAYNRRPDESPLHWLQVNNIHLKSAPLWTPQELLNQCG